MNKSIAVVAAHILFVVSGGLMFFITPQFYMPTWIPYVCWYPAVFLSGLAVADIQGGVEPYFWTPIWIWTGAWVAYSLFWIHTGGLLALMGVQP